MNGITCTSIGVKRSECHDEIGTFLDVWKVLKVRKNYIGYEVGHDRLSNERISQTKNLKTIRKLTRAATAT